MVTPVAETRDQRAERLTRLGLELADRIRTDDPDAIRRTVEALTVAERTDLVILLAAHVPIDLPRSVLIGWWEHPPRTERRPCGTVAAAKRHKAHDQPLDSACEWALREYDRVRARAGVPS